MMMMKEEEYQYEWNVTNLCDFAVASRNQCSGLTGRGIGYKSMLAKGRVHLSSVGHGSVSTRCCLCDRCHQFFK